MSDNPERTIRVNVEGSKQELEKMRKEMEEIKRKAEEERKKLQEELAKYQAQSAEAEKYKQMLEELAKKEYEDKKTSLIETLEQKRELLGDEKVDELIEKFEEAESEGRGPEYLDRVMYMTESLTEAMAIAQKRIEQELKEAGLTTEDIDRGKKREKKKPSKGTISLLPKIRRGGEDIFTREYEDARDFIHDLYEEWRNTDPVKEPTKKAKLNEAINELWRKLWEGETKAYRRTGAYELGRTMPRKVLLDKEDIKALQKKGKI